jgi:transglutaminase-like putative cysteine protease
MAAAHSEPSAVLRPTFYIDSDHPHVIRFAKDAAGSETTETRKTIALFYAVRDGIRYDPYRVDLSPEAMRASAALDRGYGFCVPKAVLLAAAGRAEGIPSRLGFADVRNHMTTGRLMQLMQTDVFVFHGYTEFLLEGSWVKVTPAFNATLCERFDVEPLEFDGRSDALLQQSDRNGNQYMEYLRDRGHFDDLPLEDLRRAFEEWYSLPASGDVGDLATRFENDAAKEGGHQ